MTSTTTFDKYSELMKDANQGLINKGKSFVAKKGRFLLDLGLAIMAYDAGVRMQAHKDFPKKRLGFNSIEEYIRESGYFEEADIDSLEEEFSRWYESSIMNTNTNQKIKKLMFEAEMFELPPRRRPGVRSALPSVKEEFEVFLAEYSPFRKGQAEKLKREESLSEEKVCNLSYSAFDEILNLVSKRSTQRELESNVGIVEFLEDCIRIYFPMLQKDLGIACKETPLVSLRKGAKRKFNALCHRCSKRLLKENNSIYCTRREDRPCYEARLKEWEKGEFSRAISKLKNRCVECGEYSSLDYIHKHRGEEKQFCGKKCLRRYRRRKYKVKRQIEAKLR